MKKPVFTLQVWPDWSDEPVQGDVFIKSFTAAYDGGREEPSSDEYVELAVMVDDSDVWDSLDDDQKTELENKVMEWIKS